MSNKQVLQANNYLDEMFIVRFHYTVDNRLNQWLKKQCCSANDVIETNTLLVDFPSIFFHMQFLNKFYCPLPPTIMTFLKETI